MSDRTFFRRPTEVAMSGQCVEVAKLSKSQHVDSFFAWTISLKFVSADRIDAVVEFQHVVLPFCVASHARSCGSYGSTGVRLGIILVEFVWSSNALIISFCIIRYIMSIREPLIRIFRPDLWLFQFSREPYRFARSRRSPGTLLSSGALSRVGAIFCRAVCSDVQIAVAKVAVTELTGEGAEKSVRNSLGTGKAIVIMETDEPKDDQQNGDAERTNT